MYTLFRIKAAQRDNKTEREKKEIHTHNVQLKTPTTNIERPS